jgi:beta-glucanase (GH16 family)
MKSALPIPLIALFALLAEAADGVEPLGDPLRQKEWKLVFNDEFDGRTLDESKWTRRSHGEAFVWNGAKGRLAEDHADVDGQGHFVVKVSRDADGTWLYHHGVETKGKFQRTYGYFETRAKFTRQPGWWGAVWLYGVEVGPNPFLMGQEIDIFEDFCKPKKKFDFAHNVHFDSQLALAPEDKRRLGKLDGNTLYRVSRGTTVLVDDWDAFHVVGVHWTPLEYVFYCDGKETFRLDYKQVPVTTQPMHILISGCFRDPNKARYQGDYADGIWPDQLTVDYVRVYEQDPGGRRKPEVTLRMSKPAKRVAPGEDVTFEVSAQSSGGPVKNVLLFDNGRIRGEQAGASATFSVPGNQLYSGENILIAMARDRDGLIGMSQPLVVLVRDAHQRGGRPYEGRPQAIPGRIIAGRYDEGGQGVAYGSYLKDNLFARPPWNLKFRPAEGISAPNATGIGASHRGLWVTYTVQVHKTGEYRVTPLVARPDAMQGYSEKPDRIVLEIDDEPLAEFTFSPRLTTGRQYWGDYQRLPAKSARMVEGKHVLSVRFDSTPFNFGGLEFTPVRGDSSPNRER